MQQLFQSAPHPTRRLLLYLNGWALGPVAVAHLGQPRAHAASLPHSSGIIGRML